MRLRHATFGLLGLLGLAALSPVHIQAQVTAAPSLMNFQGRLAKPDGSPVTDGTYSVQFALFPTLTGGTALWSQTATSVAVRNGTFAVQLSGFPANAFNGDLWLEIKIGTDPALTPRQQLVSVAYAMKANSVPDGSIGAAQIASSSITADKFAPNAFNPLAWLSGGNSGTTPATQFIGTTDAQPLVFRTNNVEQMRLDSAGNLGLGTLTPVARLDIRGGETPVGASAFIVGSLSGSQGQRAITGMWSTFMNFPADNNARRTADLVAGFDGGAWGTEYVAFNVGNNGVANDAAALTSEKIRITANGNVGIGTSTPAALLDVAGTAQMTGFKLTTGAGAGKALTSDASGVGTWQTLSLLGIAAAGDLAGTYPNPTVASNVINNSKLTSDAASLAKVSGGVMFASGGKIGILATTPLQTLDVNGGINVSGGIIQKGALGAIVGVTDLGLYSQGAGNFIRFVTNGGNFQWYADSGSGTAPVMTLQPTGELTASVVTITGGSDVAEPYEVASAGAVKPIPGYVVAIDTAHVGQMRVTARAYDKTVAGILSGANGIAPGITLRQKGTVADGSLPVASIGRVWCWCDADANGAIEAGDMLTTSDTPGHAMKATDRELRDGAVIGKAMSGLKSGKGLVLVLVSLK